MVWTDYDKRALLPASEQSGAATVPFKVIGVLHAGDHDWSVYIDNVFQGGHTQPWGGTLRFVLHKPDLVSRGTISVDLRSQYGAVRGQLASSAQLWLEKLCEALLARHDSVRHRVRAPGWVTHRRRLFVLHVAALVVLLERRRHTGRGGVSGSLG